MLAISCALRTMAKRHGNLEKMQIQWKSDYLI